MFQIFQQDFLLIIHNGNSVFVNLSGKKGQDNIHTKNNVPITCSSIIAYSGSDVINAIRNGETKHE